MEVVFHVDSKNFKSLLEKLRKDEKVSLASIKSREASIINKEGFLIIVSGLEEYCERAKEIAKESAKILEEEKEEIIKRIREEEEKAVEGFGAIIG